MAVSTIGGSLPKIGGSLTDYVEIIVGSAAELRVQRKLTKRFIAADPVQLNLRTRIGARAPSGGWNYSAGNTRPQQTFKLIMVSPAGGNIEQRTEDGTERQIDFILLGMWDAQVQPGDWWEDQTGTQFEVKALIPGNGYETRAVVEAHGKRMEGG